jgi:hypothetical protein
MSEVDPVQGPDEAVSRKPYLRPTLVVYGLLSEITRSTGNKPMDEFGGSGGQT